MSSAVVVLIAAIIGTHAPERVENWISKGPYIQNPAPDTVSIIWESQTNYPATVRVRSHGTKHLNSDVLPRVLRGVSTSSETNRPKTTNAFYLYEAQFERLQPGKDYAYEIEIKARSSKPHYFRTLDVNAGKTTFIAYGDSRSVPATHSLLAQRFEHHHPDFILHAGDLVARGTDYALWSREFFTPMRSVMTHVPIFPVIGNHEQDGTNFLSYFHLPGKELWYSFDSGPVHVLALDYRDEKADTAQYKFARNDLLATRAPWKIVLLHYPVFNIGGHASGWGHTNYLPLFREAKVDLVLSGHSHLYERFRPIAPRRNDGGWATTYITTGGGGASLHSSFDHPALATRHNTNHYVLFKVWREKLQGTVFQSDGKVFDSFQIKKSKGRLDPTYVAQAYPEESLKLVSAVSSAITSHVTGLPSVSNDVAIRISVSATRIGQATLELNVADESARCYSLDNPTLTVSTPEPGATNVVWANVRAMSQPIIVKERELSPPLIFRVKVKRGKDETIAYTDRAGVLSLPARTGDEPLGASN